MRVGAVTTATQKIRSTTLDRPIVIVRMTLASNVGQVAGLPVPNGRLAACPTAENLVLAP